MRIQAYRWRKDGKCLIITLFHKYKSSKIHPPSSSNPKSQPIFRIISRESSFQQVPSLMDNMGLNTDNSDYTTWARLSAWSTRFLSTSSAQTHPAQSLCVTIACKRTTPSLGTQGCSSWTNRQSDFFSIFPNSSGKHSSTTRKQPLTKDSRGSSIWRWKKKLMSSPNRQTSRLASSALVYSTITKISSMLIVIMWLETGQTWWLW